MRLTSIEIAGFKSFAKKSMLGFETPVTAVVGPNGSGKSNVVEAFRFVLGEQSMKSMRGKTGADLIFRGSSGASRLSRAAVSITFDNTDKVFAFQSAHDADSAKSPLLFESITFTRELFADGTSKYLMNGTEIRLKQMIELLSSVNIGASSHHIISQGEADSILRASTRDRREMLEEALGLKIYHYRIKESESKLAKSVDTLKEVQSLRRELAPHLNFLKKQVEKIEKGRAIRNELEGAMLQYLSTERMHLHTEETRLRDAIGLMERTKHDLEERLTAIPVSTPNTSYAHEIAGAKNALVHIQEKRRTVEHRIGRLEGMIEVERRLLTERSAHIPEGKAVSFAPTEYAQLIKDIEYFIDSIKSANTLEVVQSTILRLEPILSALRARQPQVVVASPTAPAQSANLKDAVLELESLQHELAGILAEEGYAHENLHSLEAQQATHVATSAQATTTRYETQNELVRVNAELSILGASKNTFVDRKALFDAELKEAGFLFGAQFLHALQNAEGVPEVNLHDLKRSIDRLKIRLDEHSGIGNDVVGEYESTVERDAFLSREVADIEGSIRNLEVLIIDLKKILDEKFTTGVAVINERFGEFFKTMFGGGSAFLEVTMEKRRKKKMSDEEFDSEDLESEDDDRFMERGIDVHVNLPEKKVKELTMLSGGERSLVSIALLFAISQVNPPPFLVLDETDAALDEANSRRYGDMIERLSEYSQLIVVTHNRETMSRASVLYGVTLGADGASKLLSIKFDEAVKVAK
jgi:chromosome segregation protein